MDFLSNLPKIIENKKKRKGRGLGSGKGSKSGRGTTRHQKARENIPLHFEGGQGRMVKKYPLLRGKGRNKPKTERPFIVHISKLNLFEDGDIVTRETLIKKGLVMTDLKKYQVKILNNGQLKKKLTVRLLVSASTKAAIEKLGGKVEV